MKREFMTDINKIKFEVYREVARMAFDGKLKECADEIPYNIIPGNTPHYRCIKRGKLSVREYGWLKDIRRCRAAILKILSRYFRQLVRAVQSTVSA